MGIAVAILVSWHLWSVAVGETSVEGHDHDVYRRMAKSRSEVSLRAAPTTLSGTLTLRPTQTFVNSYDLG